MRRVALLMVVGLLVPQTGLIAAATDAPEAATNQGVRVARFKADREAAISFTLDDGWEDNATIAAPLFDRHGIHATFFLVAGNIPGDEHEKGTHKYGQITWDRWKQIARAGHEIGNHTLQHRGLTKSDDETVRAEIEGGWQLIADRIGVAPISFAYPGNGRDDRVRKFVLTRHAVAREFETAYGGKDFTTAKANALADSALQQKRWMVVMLHAITNGYAALPNAGVLEEHLKYVLTLQDRLWIDTFGNVGRYIKERDAVRLVVQRDASSATIALNTDLDAGLFNFPLTVVIERVQAVSADAKREGSPSPLPVTVADGRLMVDVVPGPVPVTVRWQTKSSQSKD